MYTHISYTCTYTSNVGPWAGDSDPCTRSRPATQTLARGRPVLTTADYNTNTTTTNNNNNDNATTTTTTTTTTNSDNNNDNNNDNKHNDSNHTNNKAQINR